VAVNLNDLLLTSFSTGRNSCTPVDRLDNTTIVMVHGSNAPSDAVELDDGA
jgi:hypothetical protein